MYEPKIGDLVESTYSGSTARVVEVIGDRVRVRWDEGGENGAFRSAGFVPLRPTAAGQRVRCANGRTGRVEQWGPGSCVVGPDGPLGLRADEWTDALVRVADVSAAEGFRYYSPAADDGKNVSGAKGTNLSGTLSDDVETLGLGANLVGYAAWVDPDFGAKLAKKVADVSKACETAALGMGAAAYEWSAQYLGKPFTGVAHVTDEWKPTGEVRYLGGVPLLTRPAPEFAPGSVSFTPQGPPPKEHRRYALALGERVHCAATNETGVVVEKQAEHGNLYASVLLDCGEERRFGVGALAPADVAPERARAMKERPFTVGSSPAPVRVTAALADIPVEDLRRGPWTIVDGSTGRTLGVVDTSSPIAARHAGRCPTCAKDTREAGTVRLFHWLCGCPVEIEGSECEHLPDGSERNVLVWGGGTFGDGWTREEAMADWREDLAKVQVEPAPRPIAWARGEWRREIEERKRAAEKAKRNECAAAVVKSVAGMSLTFDQATTGVAMFGRALTSSTPNGDGTHSCVVKVGS